MTSSINDRYGLESLIHHSLSGEAAQKILSVNEFPIGTFILRCSGQSSRARTSSETLVAFTVKRADDIAHARLGNLSKGRHSFLRSLEHLRLFLKRTIKIGLFLDSEQQRPPTTAESTLEYAGYNLMPLATHVPYFHWQPNAVDLLYMEPVGSFLIRHSSNLGPGRLWDQSNLGSSASDTQRCTALYSVVLSVVVPLSLRRSANTPNVAFGGIRNFRLMLVAYADLCSRQHGWSMDGSTEQQDPCFPDNATSTLMSLVDGLKRSAIVDCEGCVIELCEPLCRTDFQLGNVEQRLALLESQNQQCTFIDAVLFNYSVEYQKIERISSKLFSTSSLLRSDSVDCSGITSRLNVRDYDHIYGASVVEVSSAKSPVPDTLELFDRLLDEVDVAVTLSSTADAVDDCYPYWTNIEVENAGTRNSSPMVVVRRLRTQKGHPVRQYHYNAWPDDDLPSYDHLAAFLSQLFNDISTRSFVVHSSIGTGRASVFLVIARMLTRIRLFGARTSLDVLGEVLKLRFELRDYAIQSDDQYKFLFEFLQFLKHTGHSLIN